MGTAIHSYPTLGLTYEQTQNLCAFGYLFDNHGCVMQIIHNATDTYYALSIPVGVGLCFKSRKGMILEKTRRRKD